MTDGQMYGRTDVQTEWFQILCDLRLTWQVIQNAYKFYVYVTNDEEIVLRVRIHYGKNTILDENLNECGKKLW